MKKHKKIWISGVIILLIGIAWLIGNFYYTKERQIDRIVAKMQDPKTELAQYVTASTPDMDVTDKSLKPLQNYFKEHHSAAKCLAYNLRHNRDHGEIRLIQDGRNFLLFPKYKLWIQVYRPQVKTNHANSTLTVNQKDYGEMEGGNQNYYQDLGMVFPGRYHILVKSKVNGRHLDADSIVNIWSDKTVDMKIKTATFQVRSVPNGTIYINDRKAGKLNQHGSYTFKDYPIAKRMEIYIKSKADGQTIKSERVTDLSQSISSEFSNSEDDVTDYDGTAEYQGNGEKDVYQDAEGDYIVNPIWPGLIKVGDAAKLLYNTLKSPNADDFENGKENADYKKIAKQLKEWHKKKSIKKLSVKIKVLSVLPGKRNYSRINYEVTFIKKYKDKSKKKERLSYQNAVFHQKDGKQLIQTLGDCKLIKTKTSD
ncbi:TcaA 3rd/4th domain-containing protein [Lactobacillus crispatus]|uniref:TcaA 3rd/4th domain-containing protein n=1 Tax=Lactobacillus crispatus TaxID=47770 RepID=UPI003FA5E719